VSDVVKVMMERLGKRHEARVPFKKADELAPDGMGITMHQF
jgi:Flp pilus assembly protein TadD